MKKFIILLSLCWLSLISFGQVTEGCFIDAGDFSNEIVLNETGSTSTGAWNPDFQNYQLSAFVSGASGAVEYWTISPMFSYTGATSILFNVDLFEDFDSTALELLWSPNYSGMGDPNLATWNSVQIFEAPNQGGTDYTESFAIELASIVTPESFYVAFRYADDDGATSRWRLSNMSVDTDGCGEVEPTCDEVMTTAEVVCSVDFSTYDVLLTVAGGDGNLTITNNDDNTTLAATAGSYVFGPYVAGSSYSLTVTADCDETLSSTVDGTGECMAPPPCEATGLYFAGVLDGPLAGGTPKAIQLCTNIDIADLSVYGFGSANNGGGTDGVEFTGFAGALNAGECIWLSTDSVQFNAFFGFDPNYADGSAGVNGDDALELFLDPTADGDFSDAVVVDLLGDIDVDGNGECWEYLDGYATNNMTAPNCGNFDCANYAFSGANVLDGLNSYAEIGTDIFGIIAPAMIETCFTDAGNFTNEVVLNETGSTSTGAWNPDFSNYQLSAFVSGASGAVEYWTISPLFSYEGATTVLFNVDLFEDFDSTALELLWSPDYTGMGDPNLANWNSVQVFEAPNQGGTDYIDSMTVDLSSIVTPEFFYVAFRYADDDGATSRWRLSNMSLETDACGEVEPICEVVTTTVDINCNIDLGTYDLALTSVGGDGNFTITNNNDNSVVSATTETIVFGPFATTDGYSFTVTADCDPAFTTTVEGIPNCVAPPECDEVGLYFAGVLDGPLTGGTPKAIQLCTGVDIADLSVYGFGAANNGGGTDGVEFTGFVGSLDAGNCIWLTNDAAQFTAYFGFAADYEDGSAGVNGDDALELFFDPTADGDFTDASVLDLFGDIDVDGNGECWEYLDGYAVNNIAGPNCGIFDCANYTFSGANVLDGTNSYSEIGTDVFGIGDVGSGEAAVCYADTDCDFSAEGVIQNSNLANWTCSESTYTANGFCGGGCTENSELWLISPAFELTATASRTFEFDLAQSFGGDPLLISWSNDYIGVGSPTAATWNAIGTADNGSFSIDIAALSGSTVSFAFTYTAGGGAGTTAGYDLNNIQIVSTDCNSTALAPPPACNASVGTYTATAVDACPCADAGNTMLSAVSEAGTFATDGFTQLYLLTNATGLILAQSTIGDFDATNLADGVYAMYALNYEDIFAGDVLPNVAIGQNIASLADGCYVLSSAVAASVNATACGCTVDCSGVVPPTVESFTVCEGSNTEIVLGATGSWIVNEFFPAPLDSLSDSNGDGTADGSEDEFIEFVNNTGFTVDISGWTFADAVTTRHIFSGGTIVPNGAAVVLFGGGNPTGSFGGAIVQTASTGFIGINNAGDQISLLNASNEVMVTVGYGPEPATQFVSQTRNPDLIGDFDFHTNVNSSLFSPGTQVDGSAFVGNNFVYNVYGDAALTNLLASNVTVYNPQPAVGTTETVYITTIDGSCESATATEVSVTVAASPVIEVVALDTLCNVAGGAYPTTINLDDLVVLGTGGTWTNVAGETVTSFEAGAFGDFSFIYTLDSEAGSPCPSVSETVTLRVINCGDPCDAFAGPVAQDINVCGNVAGATSITPLGAGLLGLFAPEIFISEMHYDNAGFDEGEGIEITATAGFDLTGYQVLAYNGNGGVVYENVLLSGTVSNSGNGYGAVFVPIEGLQNGSPDGIALVDNLGNLLEFLSYEGDFTANETPAAGVTSTDIGVVETNNQDAGLSMQLTDAGWVGGIANSYGNINDGLTVGLVNPPAISYSFYSDAALTNLLASGDSYDPMTVAGTTSTVFVTATDGTCISDAVSFSVSVEVGASATVTPSATICNNTTDGTQSLDLNSLITDGPNNGGTAFWADAEGNLIFLTTIDGTAFANDTVLNFTYNILPISTDGVCEAAAYPVVVTVEECIEEVDFCADFIAQDEILCSEDNLNYSVLLTFEGGSPGVNGYNISNNGTFAANTTDPIYAFGPLSGTGYALSIAPADHPECVITLSQTTVSCTTTDLDLLSFYGETAEEGNKLEWKTASEDNMDYFELLQSANSVDFAAINRQEAVGSSNATQVYNHLDINAPTGISYYQLRMVDNDGKATASNIIALERAATEFALNVSPVPTADVLNIEFGGQSETAYLQIFNVAGQLIEQWEIPSEANNLVQKDVSNYVAGVYFVQVVQGKTSVMKRFIKE